MNYNNHTHLLSAIFALLAGSLRCHRTAAFIAPIAQTTPSTYATFSSTAKTVKNISISGWFHENKYACHRQPKEKSKRTRLSLAVNPAIADLASAVLADKGRVPLRLAVGINALLFSSLRGKLLKVLTKDGIVSAFVLGCGLWTTLGWRGWTLCVLYLFFGSAVTKVKFKEKEAMGISEGRGGRRGSENVWGSALTGLVCAIIASSSSTAARASLFTLAYVTSMSTKLADTFGSEIGKAYGKTTYLFTTFKRVPAGTEGAVSLEGTLATFVGGAILPLYALAVKLLSSRSAVVVATISAFLATFAESWIGASIQGKEGFSWMTNEVVNFFNTLIGAGLSILGAYMCLSV